GRTAPARPTPAGCAGTSAGPGRSRPPPPRPGRTAPPSTAGCSGSGSTGPTPAGGRPASQAGSWLLAPGVAAAPHRLGRVAPRRAAPAGHGAAAAHRHPGDPDGVGKWAGVLVPDVLQHVLLAEDLPGPFL